MIVISEARRDISKIWGNKEPIPEKKYCLLCYSIQLVCEDGMLVLNTISGELILLDKNETERWKAMPALYEPWMDELIRKHFLVPEETDAVQIVENLRKILLLLNKKSDIVNYTILPTSACNARCFYCYECGDPHITMTEETASKVVSFIEAHNGGKPIRIRWFGGEPLIGANRITQICKELRERNIKYSSRMVSNGYLFDEKMVYLAAEEWKLKHIQITLDGTEEIYNKVKAYKSVSDNPFLRVLRNIELLLEKDISVDIRLNLGSHNYEDLTELVAQISYYFPDKQHLNVYSHLLFRDCGFEPVHFSQSELQQLLSAQELLEERIYECGLFTSSEELLSLKRCQCMANDDASVLINPQGLLGKCEHYAFDHLVGDLSCGVTDKEQVMYWKERETLPNCRKCSFYPSCLRLKKCDPQLYCYDLFLKAKKKKAILNIKQVYENYVRKCKRDRI